MSRDIAVPSTALVLIVSLNRPTSCYKLALSGPNFWICGLVRNKRHICWAILNSLLVDALFFVMLNAGAQIAGNYGLISWCLDDHGGQVMYTARYCWSLVGLKRLWRTRLKSQNVRARALFYFHITAFIRRFMDLIRPLRWSVCWVPTLSWRAIPHIRACATRLPKVHSKSAPNGRLWTNERSSKRCIRARIDQWQSNKADCFDPGTS